MGRICHVTIKLSRWRAKTMTTRASARSPIDFVSDAGSVRVPQDFISGLMFTRIDFGGQLRSCPGCRRQLSLPSVLYVGLILKLSRYKGTFSSSPQSRRLAGMGWKPFPANFRLVITFIIEVCGMWFTAKGPPRLYICLNY